MTKRAAAYLLVAALTATGCAPNALPTENTSTGAGTVERVIDGDTIELADGARVRLLQIDAPDEGECHREQSTAALRRLLPAGTQVELEADPALDDQDTYGRLLRYVHHGDTNISRQLVTIGAAAPYFYRGDRGRYAGQLEQAARKAKREAVGLWRACPGTALRPTRSVDPSR